MGNIISLGSVNQAPKAQLTPQGEDANGRQVEVQKAENGTVRSAASAFGSYAEALARTYGPGVMASAITTVGGVMGGIPGAILAATIAAPLIVPVVIDTAGTVANKGTQMAFEKGVGLC